MRVKSVTIHLDLSVFHTSAYLSTIAGLALDAGLIRELTSDKKQPNLFRGTTVHGEYWAFEFIKEAEKEPTSCKFIDEDFGLKIVGVRI